MSLKSRLFARIGLFLSLLLAPLAAAHAEWKEATTEHFVIVYDGGESSALRLARQLEGVHWLMTQATGVTPSQNSLRVRIYLVAGLDEVHRAVGAGSDSQIAGFYRPQQVGAMAVVPRSRDTGLSMGQVLFHEYAHHFMLQHSEAAFPPWYVEGFAEVVGSAQFTFDGNIDYGRPPEQRLFGLTNRWIAVNRMFSPAAVAANEEDVDYGQYWTMAHYFTFRPERRAELRAALTALRAGQSDEQVGALFAGGFAALDRDLKNYLNRGSYPYQTVPVPADLGGTPVIRTLRPGEAAIVDEEMQVSRSEMSPEQMRVVAARVGQIAARFPDEVAVHNLHARALMHGEDYVGVEAAADRALAIDPANVRAMTYKGLAQVHRAVGVAAADGTAAAVDAALLRSGRGYIVRANRAAPEDQMPLIAYFQSFVLTGQQPNDSAIDGLYNSVLRVPQDGDLRLMLAQELIRRPDLPLARRMLAPLAMSAHRNPDQKYALDLLNWIDAGATGDKPVRPDPDAEAADNGH